MANLVLADVVPSFAVFDVLVCPAWKAIQEGKKDCLLAVKAPFCGALLVY